MYAKDDFLLIFSMIKLSDAEHELYKTILNDKELRGIVQEKNPNLLAYMTGSLFRDWLPRGFIRKLLMFITALVGVMGIAATYNLWFLLLIFLSLGFSPRIVAYILLTIGSIQRGFDEGKREKK